MDLLHRQVRELGLAGADEQLETAAEPAPGCTVRGL